MHGWARYLEKSLLAASVGFVSTENVERHEALKVESQEIHFLPNFLFPFHPITAGSVAAKSSSSCDSTSDNYGTEFFKVSFLQAGTAWRWSENNPMKTT